VAAIAGGAAGVFVFSITDAGLAATPSPGSIIAVLAVTPKGGYFGVLAGVVISASVSFVVASALLQFGYTKALPGNTRLSRPRSSGPARCAASRIAALERACPRLS